MTGPARPGLDPRAAHTAAALLAPPGALLCEGRPMGGPALLALELDGDEDARRAQAGLGAIPNTGLLDALLNLPLGLPVNRSALTDRERRVLARALTGCLDRQRSTLTRLARQPARVALAVVTARRGFRDGLAGAGRFAPFCARALLLPRPPRDLTTACAEADYYGIGLLVATGESTVEVLVAPEPFDSTRRGSPHAWWFAETAYQAHLDASPARRNHSR